MVKHRTIYCSCAVLQIGIIFFSIFFFQFEDGELQMLYVPYLRKW